MARSEGCEKRAQRKIGSLKNLQKKCSLCSTAVENVVDVSLEGNSRLYLPTTKAKNSETKMFRTAAQRFGYITANMHKKVLVGGVKLQIVCTSFDKGH